MSTSQGAHGVDSGAAIPVVDDLGNHIGYKLRGSEESRNPAIKGVGREEHASITTTSRPPHDRHYAFRVDQ
jgi:hypothetical protein